MKHLKTQKGRKEGEEGQKESKKKTSPAVDSIGEAIELQLITKEELDLIQQHPKVQGISIQDHSYRGHILVVDTIPLYMYSSDRKKRVKLTSFSITIALKDHPSREIEHNYTYVNKVNKLLNEIKDEYGDETPGYIHIVGDEEHNTHEGVKPHPHIVQGAMCGGGPHINESFIREHYSYLVDALILFLESTSMGEHADRYVADGFLWFNETTEVKDKKGNWVQRDQLHPTRKQLAYTRTYHELYSELVDLINLEDLP